MEKLMNAPATKPEGSLVSEPLAKQTPMPIASVRMITLRDRIWNDNKPGLGGHE